MEPVPLTVYAGDRDLLVAHYRAVRAETERLAAPLSAEDQVVQSMPDASPTKWHRAHVTWFFETFVLLGNLDGYAEFDPHFCYLFNSYYEAVGERQHRPERGLLTRPSSAQIAAYRQYVNDAIETLIERADAERWEALAGLIVLGLHHEQQHQELILMDILHAFSKNATAPAYQSYKAAPALQAPALAWFDYPGGITEIGHHGDGFAYDNEGPRHDVLLQPFRLASRPVTNAEWKAFIADDGYRRPEFWLMDGWAHVQAEGWSAPLYWEHSDDAWCAMTLSGRQELNDQAPVCHVSYFEADAYARWAGKRLPDEAEWECAAAAAPVAGNTLGSGLLHPRPAPDDANGPQQLFGDVWEHTRSAYSPYPGFAPGPGAVGEYNGKFMISQMVLRGGACVTPDGHIRPTYRNFFYPHMRWMFAGVRLACDA